MKATVHVGVVSSSMVCVGVGLFLVACQVVCCKNFLLSVDAAWAAGTVFNMLFCRVCFNVAFCGVRNFSSLVR